MKDNHTEDTGWFNKRWRSASLFVSFMWKHIIHDHILVSAGSLAFQALLSLVPFMAVSLSILRVFPVFSSLRQYIGDFLFQNFAPAQGALLKEYLWGFIDKTSTLSTVGGLFLIIIALFLISTIDQTLNGIWEVQTPRRWLQGFTLYWTVLTLGPVFIGTSVVASSFVWYSVLSGSELLGMKMRLVSFIPFFNSAVAFFLLYMLVPNRKVRFIHAFSGGLLAAILFDLSKRWFAFYVSTFGTFEHIYGALSVIPMLFFWIYLEWLVVLTGAEFAFSLGYFKSKNADSPEFDPLYGVPEVLDVLRSVWLCQAAGGFISAKMLKASENRDNRRKLGFIVEFLEREHYLHQTTDGGVAVSVDLHTVTLFDLYSRLPGVIADRDRCLNGKRNGAGLEQVRSGVREALRSTMEMPLITLLNDSTGKES
ncbi:MAG: YihY family inner membrane protein [Chlorobiaceae bacterium]|nr:YihY family inner membrane protein [Chlorobiaceae bacterium]